MLDSLFKDVRFAARSFCKTPGLSIAIIVSIGLGIAANTTIFSMVNELLIRDMPVRDPANLCAVWPDQSPTSSYAEYTDFRDQGSAVLDGLAAHSPFPLPANMSAAGTPQRVWGQLVSGNWFPLTGLHLYLGRGIMPAEDDGNGGAPVVVLAYSLWQRLGADRSMIGKSVALSGTSYTVVGVTEPGFFGLDRGIAAEFWIPLAMRTRMSPDLVGDDMNRDNRWLEMSSRLRNGVSREQALAALNVIYARMVAEHEKGRPALPVSLRRAGKLPVFEDGLKLLLAALTVVVCLVLLIACANVANLLLARAAARQPEISVRLAVGASRGRIVRQLLTESVLLSGVGAVFGFLLSVPGTAALARLQPPLPIPIRFDFSPDTRVLLFTTTLALISGVLFGLAPALRGTRTLAGVRFGRTRMSGLLVSTQVALSVILLLGSSLFLRSLHAAYSTDIGLKADGVLMLALDTKGQGYSQEGSRQFFLELQRRLEASRDVEAASYVDLPPLGMVVNNTDFVDADGHSDGRVRGYRFNVGANYFRSMGITLLSGRDFDPMRDAGAPVAIVNRAMADRIFGGGNPIGRHVRPRNQSKSYEIIGLVRNAKVQTPGEKDKACVFHYLSDFGRVSTQYGTTLVIRTRIEPLGFVDAVRREVGAIDSGLALFNIKSFSHHLDEALLVPRLCGALFGTFGIIGLVLAIVGLFAIVNYSVGIRTREIGIRLALGARPAVVARAIVRQGIALAGAGMGVGMAVAFGASRCVASFLYGVTPTDAVTFATVPCVMLGAALVAVSVPARRASRIEPVSALRQE